MKLKIVEVANCSISDLQKLIEESQQRLIDKVLQQTRKIEDEEYITRKNASKFLQISLPTLDKYIREGWIPASQINGRYRLKKADVLNSLNQVKTNKYQRNYE